MPRTIEITMTQAGFEVLTGDRVAPVRRLADAVGYARAHLARNEHIHAVPPCPPIR